ncbi:MAG: hypothetical protein L0Z70_12335 [Chloroflexi bacterium]|nr:hypothetical protein [Chloroflexota bacterium]
MIAEVERAAERVLAGGPGAASRCRLLRDALRRPAEELGEARAALEGSRWVQELAREQRADGGWGAFHSRSTKEKQKTASTEVGVERALALGLDAAHPILSRAGAYLRALLEGRIPFPDYHEKNDRWPTGMCLFQAATYSLIDPVSSLLDGDRALWGEIARRTFRSGEYREADEIRAHAELTGATVQGSYLRLNNRYALNLLGSPAGAISGELTARLLDWLWRLPEGIGYLGAPLNQPPPRSGGVVERWLASHEMLARLFPGRTAQADAAMEWLWRQQNAAGRWDFGPRPGSRVYLPLSDDWRDPRRREEDWSTRVLCLLRIYYEGA